MLADDLIDILKTEIIQYFDGSIRYLLNGQLHRIDGPAVVYPDGSEQWYRFGLRHRDNGPAITYANGEKYWYCDDYCATSGDVAIISTIDTGKLLIYYDESGNKQYTIIS